MPSTVAMLVGTHRGAGQNAASHGGKKADKIRNEVIRYRTKVLCRIIIKHRVRRRQVMIYNKQFVKFD